MTGAREPPETQVFSPVHGAFREAVSARRSRRVCGDRRADLAPFTGLLAVWLEPSSRVEAEARTPRSPVNGAPDDREALATRRERRAYTASRKAPGTGPTNRAGGKHHFK